MIETKTCEQCGKDYLAKYSDCPECNQGRVTTMTGIKDLTTGRKLYSVSFYYEEVGNVFVNANSREEAEQKLSGYLGDVGDMNELAKARGFECCNRNYGVNSSREYSVETLIEDIKSYD
jgi:hypothetical protein